MTTIQCKHCYKIIPLAKDNNEKEAFIQCPNCAHHNQNPHNTQYNPKKK